MNHCEVFGETYSSSQATKWRKLFKLIESNMEKRKAEHNLILIIDAVKPFKYYEKLIKSKADFKSVLVIVEQPSVNPLQHKKKYRKLFDLVFVSSQDLAEKYGAIYFTFPLRINPFQEISRKDPQKKIMFGIVATSKNSLVKSSLYKLRPAVINYLAKSDQIIFGGKDFNTSRLSNLRMDLNYSLFLIRNGIRPHLKQIRYRKLQFKKSTYLGEVEKKEEVFEKVDVVLCFENDTHEFSEKFIDTITAGKVPLYVGPNLDSLGIPRSVYIKAEPNLRQIKKTIKTIDSDLVNSKLNSIKSWRLFGLNPWEEENAFQALAAKITALIDVPSVPKS